MEAHFGGQFQGPQIGGLIEGTGTLVQQGPQLFGLLARKSGVDSVGARGTLAQSSQAGLVEGLDSIADRFPIATQVVGSLGGQFPSGAGQQNLAAAQDEGMGRAQACLQVLALGVGQGRHKYRSFHTP
jgi:hypothetical protein